MGRWASVAICWGCWFKLNPAREPSRLVGGVEAERCCDCRRLTTSGIFVRRELPA